MKRTIVAFLLVPFSCLLAASPRGLPGEQEKEHRYEPGHGIHWAESLEDAFRQARKLDRPVMVDFEAEWCGWCKKLDRETYGNEAVIRFVHDNLVAVKVDTDENQEIAKTYRVSGLPTILVLAPDGRELQRLRGFHAPDLFLKKIQETSASAKLLEKLKKAAEDAPENVAAQRAYARALLAGNDTAGASEVLKRALERAPEDAGLLLDLADVQRAGGKLKEARESYEKILMLPDERARAEKAGAYLPLGRLLVTQREHEAALDVLGKFIALNKPEKGKDNKAIWEAYFLRGYVHAVMKKAEKALADLKVVRDEDAESPWAIRASYIIDVVQPR